MTEGAGQPAASRGGGHGRRGALAAFAMALLVAAAPEAGAADAAAGREKARACAVCHGPMGLSVVPDAPNLAGQPPLYLGAQLRAYRSGKRVHEIMSVMAKPLTDAEIDDLAAWFGSLKVEVKPPP